MQLADSTVFTRRPAFSPYCSDPSVLSRWISRKMIHLHSFLFAVPTSTVHRAANRQHTNLATRLARGLQNGGHLCSREIHYTIIDHAQKSQIAYRGNVIVIVGIPRRTNIFKCWSNKASVGSDLVCWEQLHKFRLTKFSVLVALDVILLLVRMWNKRHCLVKYYT